LLGLLLGFHFFVPWGWAKDTESEVPPTNRPLFTGSLLSITGRTVPQGHLFIRPYISLNRYGGLYANTWRVQSASVSRTTILGAILPYGLTDRIDIIMSPQWIAKRGEDVSTASFGDFPVSFGFQALRSPSDSWLPDVRLWVQEVFPTGSYTGLSPTTTGVTGTGGGSFGTTLGIAAEKVHWLTGPHFLKMRVNVAHSFYSPVIVQGFNSYGGGFGTEGRVEPGSLTSVTLAGECTLTRHVAFALDIGYQYADGTRFSGATGVGASGESATVGRRHGQIVTLAPALEYNWNEHGGVIAGLSLSVAGKNRPEFFGVMVALQVFM
jgi:hypothetical protein